MDPIVLITDEVAGGATQLLLSHRRTGPGAAETQGMMWPASAAREKVRDVAAWRRPAESLDPALRADIPLVKGGTTEHAAAKGARYSPSESKRPRFMNISFESGQLPSDYLFQAIGRFTPSCRELRKRHTDDWGMRRWLERYNPSASVARTKGALDGLMKHLPACFPLLIVAASRLLAQTGGDVAPVQAVESMQLAPEKAIDRQLAAGQSHEYQLSLQAGQYARVQADQIGIDLSIACFGPDGKERFEVDTSPIGDPEDAELIGDASGIYRLRIKASEPQAPNGRYEIALRDMEPATERHRERVAAARAFAQGMDSYRQDTRQAMLQALDYFSEALPHWRAAEARVEAAKTLYTSGLTYIEIGNQQEALAQSTQALALAQAANDLKAEARALNAIGEVHNYFGDKRIAIGYYEQALPLMRTSGDRAGEGNALNNLAVAYAHTGEKPKALALFSQADQIFRELHDRRMIAEVASNLGVTYDNLGEYQAALESHQHNLALKRELGERGSQAIALNNIGTAYSGLDAYQKALDAYTAALEINRSLDNRRNVAINLNNIAWVYDQLADYRRAAHVLSGVARDRPSTERSAHNRGHAQQHRRNPCASWQLRQGAPGPYGGTFPPPRGGRHRRGGELAQSHWYGSCAAREAE